MGALMNRTEPRDPRSRPLTTADLAAAARESPLPQEEGRASRSVGDRADEPSMRDSEFKPATPERERLDALFPPDMAERYRARWATIQSSFVDDPRPAARQGDELVADVMKNLAESFAHEREALERQLNQPGEASTETLRVALRRYRSFFERLLSL